MPHVCDIPSRNASHFRDCRNYCYLPLHLIELHISIISSFRVYFTPEAMATGLSMLTSLETLSLQFQSPSISHPDWEGQSLPPTTRSVLPTPTYFRFKGVSEYLEDLVARIDAPRLNGLDVTFFDQIARPISIHHSLPNSSVARQHSRHPMKQACSFIVVPSASRFYYRQLSTKTPR